jgi:hypothetical protein
MPIYVKLNGVEGVVADPEASGAPFVSEMVVTKSSDVSADPRGGEKPVASGPGDESPVGSGPRDEKPIGSGPGDEIGDDGFAIDSFAVPVDPSDPSDGLRPMESLLPMESFHPVDPWDPSAELSVAETTYPGGYVPMEMITLHHEGFYIT